MCIYSDAYIVVKKAITVTFTADVDKSNKKLTFKSSVPFRSWKSKISNTFIDNVVHLHIVKQMYNLLEYRDNYSLTSRSLWNCYRNEVNNAAKQLLIIGLKDHHFSFLTLTEVLFAFNQLTRCQY